MPQAVSGTFYALVYGDSIQTPGPYTLMASSSAVILSSLVPSTSGANQPFTITLSGAGFDASSSARFLDASNNAYAATSISVDSFTQMTVNEGAGALPPGMYSLSVSLASGASSTLTNAFQVLPAAAPNLVTSITLPGQIGYHIPATIYVQYGNTGNAAMPAPLLTLTATQDGREGAFLTLDSSLIAQGLWTSAEPAGFSHAIQILGSGNTPGVLQPGESMRVPVYYAGWQQPWDFSYPPVAWTLGSLQTTNEAPVNWASVGTNMQPATILADAWNAIFEAFTNEVGSAWGGYVTMLDNNASYLGRLGLDVVDVGKLLAFQFMQADGLCPLQTLASSLDASVPAPGSPLTFSRSYGERISQRYALGPFGRGWSHNWQYSLQQGSDGTITVFGPGGSRRLFQPDTRGGYFNQAGDYGTLGPAGGGAFTLTEKTGLLYYYRSDGKLGYVQDLNNNTVTLGYTGNLLTSLSHSAGQSMQISYNGAGLIQTVTDNLGRQTLLTYDAANQHLTGAQFFDGRTSAYTYNTSGSPAQLHELTAASSSCCNWRYFTYDTLGQLTGTYLGGNAQAVTFSHGAGAQITATDALGDPAQFFYDHRGLLAKTVDANANAVYRHFDQNYNLVSLVDPAGRSYNYGYDNLGNLISSTDPMGNNSQFTFAGPYNRLASVTDAKGNPTHYSYDAYGNLESTTYADGSVESWSYDSEGNPRTWKNRRGHQTAYTVKDNGQITGKHFADGSATESSYDSQGNLTNSTTYDPALNPLESVAMTYDSSNHLTRMDYPGGKFLSFTYDSNGRRLSSVDQLGHTLNYYYDQPGRLVSMTNELNSLVVLYRYDAAGRIATKTVGNGMLTTYQYDPAGQILTLTNALTDGTLLSFFNYSYDTRGRRASMASVDGDWTYSYDDLGQLVHAVFASVAPHIANQDLGYVYDSVGNRTQTIENGVTTSYTANSLNQYVSVGQTNYTFDADGNLIGEVSPLGTTTYTYDDESRLIAMTTPQEMYTWGYNGLGDRASVTTGAALTRYIIDPINRGNLVGEYDGSGSLVAHYDHSLELISRSDDGNNIGYYILDALGSVQQLVAGSGYSQNYYAYSPFGSSLKTVEVVPNPFRFDGRYGVQSDDDGHIFMRARVYATGLGRFYANDPVSLSGHDLNLYRFTGNNPLSFSDPSGTTMVGISFPGGEASGGYDPKTGETIVCGGGFIGTPFGGYLMFGSDGNVSVSLTLFDFGISWTTDSPAAGAYQSAWGGAGIVVGGSASESPGGVEGSVGIGWGGGAGFSVGGCVRFPPGPPGPPGGPQPGPAPITPPPPLPCIGCGPNGTNTVTVTHDPNGLIGPAGYGPAGYIAGNALLSYRIDFENETNASAPSQQVNITDQLSGNYDWSTFNVSEFGFGDLVVALPPGTSYVQTNVPFSYLATAFQVQVQIGIRPTTGLVYANFQSIDPATGLPPPAGIGFLPPEDGTGRGQGHVAYTIRAKAGLATGAQLTNVALISFDEEPQIATDQVNDSNPAAGTDPARECLLTIDSTPPVSSVSSLPAVETTAAFAVCWSGTDIGPGIVGYDIYVCTNNGPWAPWLLGTTNTCATFTGQNGMNYSFYSVAHDGVGLVEAAPSMAQASTTITIPFLALPQQTNLVVDELTMMVVTNTAIEPNPSAYPLSYALLGAPSGAAIDTNGIITWIPNQAQSPGTNVLTTTVTDSATPPHSATNTFSVIVLEVNVPPMLPIVSTQAVNELTLLTVTNTATESNIHSTLGYALVNPPAGMTISANGIITWTPQQNQSPSTNLVTTVVTNSNPYDPANPHLSATNSFTVIVKEVNAPQLEIVLVSGLPQLTWSAVPGWRYQVWCKEALANASWMSAGGVLTASGQTLEFTDSTTSGANARFYRVQALGPP